MFVIFFIFYIIVSKNLLLAISQVKKVRLKQGSNKLNELIDEQKRITSVYDESVLRCLSES